MVYSPHIFYRPQRSRGKVTFSQACVNNSVHRGVSAPVHAEIHTAPWVPGQTPLWVDSPSGQTPSGQTPPPGQTPPGQTPLQADTASGRHFPVQAPSWADTPPWVDTPMGTHPQLGTHPPPPHSPSPRRPLHRTVRILLECILVFKNFS